MKRSSDVTGRSARRASPVPRLLALATAVPPRTVGQGRAAGLMRKLLGPRLSGFERLSAVYRNSGIKSRAIAVPHAWFKREHGLGERNRIYLDTSVRLLERVARECFATAGLRADQVDDLIVVSSTGIATPSLDAVLMGRLGMSPRVRRTPLFGLGCAGGVLGLGRATALAGNGRTVLLLVVELCSLSFQKSDVSKKNLVASALFGDGAAGALIGFRGRGPRLYAQEEHTWPGTLDVMGWNVVDTGFSVVFSRSIPHLVRSRLRSVLDGFLRRQALSIDDVDEFICHPGGAKVLDALEEVFGVKPGALEHSRRTLSDQGNMSAPTVLFSLKEALRGAKTGRKFVLTSLGPGFTAAMMLVEA